MNEVEITIEGLNSTQRVLADIIWACDSRKQVNAFVRSLPTLRLQQDAYTVLDLIIAATIEQCPLEPGNMHEAEQLIQRVSK